MATTEATPLQRRLAGEEEEGAGPVDAFHAARRKWLGQERIDMGELATELGISRATLYRWVGSREQLIGEIIWSLGEAEIAHLRETVRTKSVEGYLELTERFLAATLSNVVLRRFVEAQPESALRILHSKDGVVQRRLIDFNTEMLQELIDAGELETRLDAHDLAFAVVRIGESFSWTDYITGDEPDASKAAEVLRMLLT